MSPRDIRAGLIVVFTVSVLLCPGQLLAQSPTAQEVIERVLTARRTTGFRARAQLVRTTKGSDSPVAWQFAISGRQEGDYSQLLYFVQRPKDLKGHALVVNRSAKGEVGGFFFEPPGTVRELSRRDMSQPIFGSDLLLEDVTDAYLHWPQHRLAGEDVVRKRNCLIIESRPGSDAATRYSLVRACVIPELNLPVRIEKFDRQGQLVKTIHAEKVIKQGNLWLASVLSTVPADQRWRSTFTIFRGERGINLPPEEFSPANIKRLLNPPPTNKAPISGRPAS